MAALTRTTATVVLAVAMMVAVVEALVVVVCCRRCARFNGSERATGEVVWWVTWVVATPLTTRRGSAL